MAFKKRCPEPAEFPRHSRAIHRLLTFCLLTALSSITAAAQVLARPGWAGSGVTTEVWWRHAVFYRIQPALFQQEQPALEPHNPEQADTAPAQSPSDKTTPAQGDLQGIIERLGYIHDLGIDAIVLRQPFSADDFGDLTSAASQHSLRVLVELNTPDPMEARHWLTEGAAGLYLDGHDLHTSVTADELTALRRLTGSFPGRRVLLAADIPAASGLRSGPQLVAAEDITTAKLDAASLRSQLADNLNGSGRDGNVLLDLPGLAPLGTSAADDAVFDRATALLLFASRGAVLFDAGRELGLRSLDGSPVIMQWTPTNITPKPKPQVTAPPPPKIERLPPNVYGTFHPYVAPPPVVVPPLLPPIATLPGFTAGTLPHNTAVNGTTANAATESRNPESLLNFYRKLIGLHHGDPTLRDGAEFILDRDAQNVLVWVRRPPSGTTTTAPIIAACNLSAKTVEFSLDDDLANLGLRSGGMMPLATFQPPPALATQVLEFPFESTDAITLPAQSVYLGQLDIYGNRYTQPRRRQRQR